MGRAKNNLYRILKATGVRKTHSAPLNLSACCSRMLDNATRTLFIFPPRVATKRFPPLRRWYIVLYKFFLQVFLGMSAIGQPTVPEIPRGKFQQWTVTSRSWRYPAKVKRRCTFVRLRTIHQAICNNTNGVEIFFFSFLDSTRFGVIVKNIKLHSCTFVQFDVYSKLQLVFVFTFECHL